MINYRIFMLYIVATPIGNLEDITLRALRVLKEVDFILCEDTRVTKKLLERHKIEKPLISYHQHSRLNKINYILQLLKEDKNLALVSDSGTPGISDPGDQLIKTIVEKLGQRTDIIPLPGPSAAIAALSISGLPTDKFIFLGFPPHKKGRQKFFQEVGSSPYTVVFYESPHRILKTLNDLRQIDSLKNKQIVVCRELTKKFESVYRSAPIEVLEILKNSPDNLRGEFVIVI